MGIRRSVARLRLGPKRSRVKVGPWPFLFFLVMAIALGAAAITLNTRIAEQWASWRAAHDEAVLPDPPDE